MKASSRMVFGLLTRLLFVGFAAWVALSPDAAPGAPPLTRIALASAFLTLAILLGEVIALRTQFSLLMGAIRGVGASAQGGRVRDDRAAVEVLLRGLSASDPVAREKAHKHLKRLTGQDLPPDPDAWAAWWADHRDEFPGA